MDDRFTDHLIADVLSTLREHGYEAPSGPGRTRAQAATVAALLTLTQAFEGRGGSDAGSTCDPMVATARDHFAQVLAGGDLPSVRAIRRELHVGEPRARRIRAALAAREQGGHQ